MNGMVPPSSLLPSPDGIRRDPIHVLEGFSEDPPAGPDGIRRYPLIAPDGIRREPVIFRKTVTKEMLAVAVGHPEECDRPGCGCKYPRKHLFEKALHANIAALVRMFAVKYSVSCREDYQDLEQEVFKRLFRVLPKFDPARGGLSTWTWRICTSVLNGRYRRRKKHIGRQVEVENLESVGATTNPRMGRLDMVEAIRDLFMENLDRSALLEAIFGDPFADDYEIPTEVCVSKASRESGMPYGEACQFYKKVVRPFFETRFEMGRSRKERVDE